MPPTVAFAPVLPDGRLRLTSRSRQPGRTAPSPLITESDCRFSYKQEPSLSVVNKRKESALRYISLFSGVEAATLAWEPLGWEPVAFAEIDPFPSAVLAERWPNVPNLGDVSKVDWSPYRGTVDVVVGGSPCQAFSIAGRREGLMDTRGQLMLEYVRAVAEIKPRWFIWENVPGVLSQDRGRAFGTLLREMDELRYGMAWRVLDAQFFGVAQRRRRVFLVGHLGDRPGASAAVLFEPESVSGNTTSSKQKREALAADARRCAQDAGGGCLTPWDVQSKQVFIPDSCGPTLNAGGNNWNPKNVQPCVITQDGDDVSRTLTARMDSSPSVEGRGPSIIAYNDCLTPWDVQSKRIYETSAVGPTLNRGAGMTTTPSVLQQVEPDDKLPAVSFQTGQTTGNGSGVNFDDVSYTITTSNDQAVAFVQNQRDEVRLMGGDGQISGSIPASYGRYTTHKQETLIAEPIVMASAHTNAEIGEGGVTPTLIAHIAKDAPVLAMEASESSSIPFDDVTVIDRAAYNQGQNAQYPPHIEQTDVMDTLVARGPHAVGYSYRTEMT